MKTKESRGFILLMVAMFVAPVTFLFGLWLAGVAVASTAATVSVAIVIAAGGTSTARALKDLFIGRAEALIKAALPKAPE